MYFVKESSIATSRLYEKDDKGIWNYWYDNEKTFWFLNTAHWENLNKSKNIWVGEDLEEAKNQVIKYSKDMIQKQIPELKELSESIYIVYIQQLLLNVNNDNLTNAIESFDEIKQINQIINRLKAIENSIDELFKEKKNEN